MFSAAGVPFKLSPRFTGYFVWARVVSGDPYEHVRRLEESEIVRWADWRGRTGWPYETWIEVQFGASATDEQIRELFNTMPELEPDWDAVNWNTGPWWASIQVPERHEFAWIVALEAHPKITWANLSFYLYTEQ